MTTNSEARYGGTVEFVVSTRETDFAFDRVSFPCRHEGVTDGRVQCDFQTGVSGSVRTSGFPSRGEAVAAAESDIDRIVGRLCLHYNLRFEPTRIDGSEVRSETPTDHIGSMRLSSAVSMRFRDAGSVRQRVSVDSIADLLSRDDVASVLHVKLYREAFGAADGVERFMRLYGLLLMLCGDSQKRVDQVIRRYDPDVEQTQSPIGNFRETIYTRLRNELGHAREGVDPNTTVNEMRNCSSGLARIIKSELCEIRRTAS